MLTVKWTSSQSSNAVNTLGILTFDGISKVTASLTSDSAGTVTKVNASGTYSVSSDGGGSLTVTDKQNNSGTISFVINSAGKGSQLMLTACSSGCSNEVVAGTATHQ